MRVWSASHRFPRHFRWQARKTSDFSDGICYPLFLSSCMHACVIFSFASLGSLNRSSVSRPARLSKRSSTMVSPTVLRSKTARWEGLLLVLVRNTTFPRKVDGRKTNDTSVRFLVRHFVTTRNSRRFAPIVARPPNDIHPPRVGKSEIHGRKAPLYH